MIRSLTVCCLVCLAAALAAAAPADADGSAPLRGVIRQADERTWLAADDGRRLLIEGDGAICFKYANYRIEVLDPQIGADATLQFTHYRILAGDDGQALDFPPRKILNTKNRQPYTEFQFVHVGPTLRFTLYLANRSDKPLRVRFPSSQKYDFAVMTPDQQTTLWRWSWGRNFEIGYSDLILAPGQQYSFTEKWEYQRDYVEDGEYIAFAELHCLPHGILTDVQKFIIQTKLHQLGMQPYFFPLDLNNTWTYRAAGGGPLLKSQITGLATAGGREYYVISFFPDADCLDDAGEPQLGDSRFIRWDPATAEYREWTPQGERSLLGVGGTRRLLPAEKPASTPVGQFTTCLEYRALEDRTWVLRGLIVPGLGLIRTVVPREDRPPVELELVDVALGPAARRPEAAPPPAVPGGALGDFRLLYRRTGGLPPEDFLLSLRANGTLVVLEQGAITRQAVVSAERLWALIQVMDGAGLFQLNERYGDGDLDNPLTIELGVVFDGRARQVRMRTSAKDKPPQAFWTIVNEIENLLKSLP